MQENPIKPTTPEEDAEFASSDGPGPNVPPPEPPPNPKQPPEPED